MRVAVVIPVYNEEKNIIDVVSKVRFYAEEIIVVDDGSKDRTFDVIQSLGGIHVCRHRTNLGKGAALKTGCEFAYVLGVDVIICMDGDRQHRPEDIPRFVKKMQETEAEILFGFRKIGEDMPWMMTIGNRFLSLATLLLYRINVSDTQCGFRAFRAIIYPKIRWESRHYAVETEMIVNAGKHHLKFDEIIIQTIYHDRYKGTTVLDGVKIFCNMVLWKIQ